MDGYRIYFLDNQRLIVAAHWFEADGDESALWIAARLYDACSDVCDGFELWHMARRVGDSNTPARVAASAAEINEQRQQRLIAVEETLRDSAFRVATSRRLLKTLEGATTARNAVGGRRRDVSRRMPE